MIKLLLPSSWMRKALCKPGYLPLPKKRTKYHDPSLRLPWDLTTFLNILHPTEQRLQTQLNPANAYWSSGRPLICALTEAAWQLSGHHRKDNKPTAIWLPSGKPIQPPHLLPESKWSQFSPEQGYAHCLLRALNTSLSSVGKVTKREKQLKLERLFW